MVESSVTEPGLLESVSADRPTVVVFEGLSMYLREQEGKALIQRITGRFLGGALPFDYYGTLGIRLQKMVAGVRNAGATLYWGIDDPYQLEGRHEGLRCTMRVEVHRRGVRPGGAGHGPMPRHGRIALRALALVPGFRRIGTLLRYRC